MKGKHVWTLALVLTLAVSTVALAASVGPILVADWQSGNAESECAEATGYTGVSYMYAYKVDGWCVDEGCDPYFDGNGTYGASFPDGHTNSITIGSSDGYTFNWSATPNPIGAVIVKGGPSANIFAYDPQVYGDTGLYAPVNPENNKNYAISHVTFCWNPEEEWCWEDETAWAAGTRYVEQGNWAMYVGYEGVEKTVNLLAGQFMAAGTVHFSAPVDGQVIITITLNEGWRFALDEEGEPVEENVKVQDYASTPPAENPSPGLFAWKGTATASPFSIVVPENNFYGVHVDVQHQVLCQ